MKFHPLFTKLFAEDGKSLKFRQTKGNYSTSTDDSLIKLYMHRHNMVIFTQYKFHEIPFIAY